MRVGEPWLHRREQIWGLLHFSAGLHSALGWGTQREAWKRPAIPWGPLSQLCALGSSLFQDWAQPSRLNKGSCTAQGWPTSVNTVCIWALGSMATERWPFGYGISDPQQLQKRVGEKSLISLCHYPFPTPTYLEERPQWFKVFA